jgi:hypothetical protein
VNREAKLVIEMDMCQASSVEMKFGAILYLFT